MRISYKWRCKLADYFFPVTILKGPYQEYCYPEILTNLSAQIGDSVGFIRNGKYTLYLSFVLPTSTLHFSLGQGKTLSC